MDGRSDEFVDGKRIAFMEAGSHFDDGRGGSILDRRSDNFFDYMISGFVKGSTLVNRSSNHLVDGGSVIFVTRLSIEIDR